MSTKGFAFPADASMDEVEELVGQGLDAMFDTFYAGNKEVNVVFSKESIVLEGLQETKKDDNSDNDKKNKNTNEDEPGNNDAAGEVLDEEEVCVECFENPCIFFATKNSSSHSTKRNTA
jgi:hypothetical protein